jgi:hypothetical protein
MYSFSQNNMSSKETCEPDKKTNPACHDDSPVAGSTDAIQEKNASDLESGMFNPSTETVSTTAPTAETDHNIIYWSGPDDPENPLNWSRRKRVSHVTLVSVITFIS